MKYNLLSTTVAIFICLYTFSQETILYKEPTSGRTFKVSVDKDEADYVPKFQLFITPMSLTAMGTTANLGFMLKPEFALNQSFRLTAKLSMPYSDFLDSGYKKGKPGAQKMFVETNLGVRLKLVRWYKLRNRKINIGIGGTDALNRTTVYVGGVPLTRSHQIDMIGGVDYFQTGFESANVGSPYVQLNATQSSSIFFGLNYETIMNYSLTINGKSGMLLRSIRFYFYSKAVVQSKGYFWDYESNSNFSTNNDVSEKFAFRGGMQLRMLKFKSIKRHHLLVVFCEFGTFPGYDYYPYKESSEIAQFGLAYVFNSKSIKN